MISSRLAQTTTLPDLSLDLAPSAAPGLGAALQARAASAAIRSLALASAWRDPDLYRHMLRVQALTTTLARALTAPRWGLDLPPAYRELLREASLLHDLGKVAIPLTIRHKPGPLTHDEYGAMTTHTWRGASLILTLGKRLPASQALSMARQIARGHHERWDGSGYPHGLVGEDIPLAARIVAVADVYDALRSERPYKRPLSHRPACDIIVQGAGTLYDPLVVGALLWSEREMQCTWDVASSRRTAQRGAFVRGRSVATGSRSAAR